MNDVVEIANRAISELKKSKEGHLRFGTPSFLAIAEDDKIETSIFSFNLKEAYIAVVILPYSYRVVTADDSSAFVIFIDSNGYCNDSITINGWTLMFETPKESSYRTYHRYATISKDEIELTLSTPNGSLTPDDFKQIWKYFKLISTNNECHALLPLVEELYDNEVEIKSLKREIICREHELFITQALLKANKELIENIKHLINSTKEK